MKSYLVTLVCGLFALEIYAAEPFTSKSTGLDWQQASLEYRAVYCQQMAKTFAKDAPGITADYIFEGVQEVYKKTTQKEQTKIVEAVALIVTAYQLDNR